MKLSYFSKQYLNTTFLSTLYHWNGNNGFLKTLLLILWLPLTTHAFQNEVKTEVKPKKLIILESDSIKIQHIYVASFSDNKVDTIIQNFDQILCTTTHVNLQIEVKELYKSGWYKAIYFINQLALNPKETKVQLTKDYTPSPQYYKEQTCVSAGLDDIYTINIRNQTDQYIFKMKGHFERHTDTPTKWDDCYSRYNGIHNMLPPMGTDSFKKSIYRIEDHVFSFGMYNPQTKEITTLVITDYEIEERSYTDDHIIITLKEK